MDSTHPIPVPSPDKGGGLVPGRASDYKKPVPNQRDMEMKWRDTGERDMREGVGRGRCI